MFASFPDFNTYLVETQLDSSVAPVSPVLPEADVVPSNPQFRPEAKRLDPLLSLFHWAIATVNSLEGFLP